MPRTPARCTQADIERAIRAVAQSGHGMRVRIERDGTIIIEAAEGRDITDEADLDARPEFVL